MMLTECENILGRGLLRLPAEHKYRYGPAAEKALLELLFRSLAGHNEERLKKLFPNGLPTGLWKLTEAQGAVEGAEYTEAARGKRCGHIFRAGEATYRCTTCGVDETCVLCSRCFDASDHSTHQYEIYLSPGNSGCCDCGDEEAWRTSLFCAIHTDNGEKKGKEPVRPQLPQDWVDNIKLTISRVLDYFCDVISCSPEQLRLPKTAEAIRKDEEASRIHSGWYGEGHEVEEEPEFALALWNDEKHTIRDVAEQVSRACRERDRFGQDRAQETHEYGRSVVKYSTDLPRLLQVSKVIEQIKVTVTIRSSRDTFREQMCGTIVEWLEDIAGCSVLDDNEILRQTICEELLGSWRRGSGAFNADIGLQGIDDHSRTDIETVRTVMVRVTPQGELLPPDEDDEDDIENRNDDTNEEEDAGVMEEEFVEMEAQDAADDGDDEMEIELNRLAGDIVGDGDMVMDGTDDALQIAQALLGFTHPFPGRQGEQRERQQEQAHSNNESPGAAHSDPPTGTRDRHEGSNNQNLSPYTPIPRTLCRVRRLPSAQTPSHWQVQPSVPVTGEHVPPYEDLWQRTRLDWMILFDLRLWKKARTDLRDLYLGTVVNVPQFKRVMGLRLSALYTALSQLYLIADREPDHSIINLTLQLLTAPSITEEIVLRGNFLTKVMAILYTFLTTRQVGEPFEVNPIATLSFDTGAGPLNNRRLYHFFCDLRYLLQSEYVQNRVRNEEQYLLQFLDLVKLAQGVCPNLRAVGEHVEYENDAWISASILTREINRLCISFREAFKKPELDGGQNLLRAITVTTIATVVNSVGCERERFAEAEIKEYIRFKTLPPFDFEVGQPERLPRYRVVDFVVEKGAMSFHHPLHYTLSWLLGCARNERQDTLREVLLSAAEVANDNFILDSDLEPEDLLLAMFDYPLRVCAWLAQMKAGMWVRNGLSLRHQMSQYRGVTSRELGYYRDISLLQAALVTCNPSRVLASIADRFGVVDWMTRNYIPRAGYEDAKVVDVVEEFILLLIVLLTDRKSLAADGDRDALTRENMSREIAHVLCFNPLSFSDLSTRLSDQVRDSDLFHDILDEIARFRPPEGLNDTGTFELKPDYISLIDPYSAHYTKNQRDEAEGIYKEWMAKRVGKPASDIVFEPKLRPLASGVFSDLARFTRTPLFAQIVHQCLDYVVSSKDRTPTIPSTRVETFLQVVLHLILSATLEDNTDEDSIDEESAESFVSHALTKARATQVGNLTLVGLLEKISVMNEFSTCGPKIRHILKRLWQKRPRTYTSATASLKFPFDRIETNSPAIDTDTEKELRKKQALERQAKVMAQFQQQQQNFLNNQGAIDWGGEDFSDLESEPEVIPQAKLWKYPSGTCILCQEETNDSRLYGTFALVQESSIFRQTDIQDADWIRDVLKTPSNLDKSAEHLRPFGVAGENHVTVRRLDSSGGEVTGEKIGLSKGFNAKNTARGPVTTGCGHIMHYTCFEVYFTATQRRHTQQIARNHPERLSFKEFVCPLCKALGNAFLPITWKGKEESYPGPLNTKTSFDEFVNHEVKSILSHRLNHALLMESGDLPIQSYQGLYLEYLSKTLVPPLSGRVDQLLSSSLPSTAHYIPPARIPMPGVFPPQEESSAPSPPQPAPTLSESPMSELLQIYTRLKQTLRLNHVYSTFSHPPETTSNDDIVHTDSLFQSFGFSIAAVEIAQRGVESEQGSTLLDKIPQLTLTHLRVLAETALTYASVGGLYSNNGPPSRALEEFHEMHRQKLCQLFVGHPVLGGTSLLNSIHEIEPLFSKDTFVFLAECSLALRPVLDVEIRHLIQMCYVAEIVKVAASYILWPIGLKEELAQHGDAHYLLEMELSDGRFEMTRNFFNTVVAELKANSVGRAKGSSYPVESGYVKEGEDSATPGVIIALRRLISSYALTFLRKAVILLHVQYGLEFPNTGLNDVGVSELDRLTKALDMPSLDAIFSSTKPARKSRKPFDAMISGWIFHWNASRSGIRIADNKIFPSLPHPAIFELVGLPKYFDSLIELANRRRCPKSKKELSDPSICLFCGDIFCSQAVCCLENGLGGCNQHVPKCGKNIGLFINIRKCMVLYLHNQSGSWHYAPYLDRHGEVDPGLRRNRPLMLNQKRYDRLLRDVWLSHSVPATISRRLEADVNNGGWETI
ncbi:putative ubiquitin-protein ligase E3 component (UBR1) [Aspergillus lucknowensis]|uniref:E3 ubiquitin-protein ligase n=1 Tax=Aspergillus lucknowensis TaxID=176173 RepID=A0ABR4M2D3_9EURO